MPDYAAVFAVVVYSSYWNSLILHDVFIAGPL